MHIKLFEEYSNSIDSYLTESTFDELPINYKKGLLSWYYEVSDEVDWSYIGEITDWVNDPNVDILIDDFSKAWGHLKYWWGDVPTQLVIDKVTEWIDREGDFASFDEWHKAYHSTNEISYGDSKFSIYVDENDEEYILDGWHRFNHYVHMGYENIPIITQK